MARWPSRSFQGLSARDLGDIQLHGLIEPVHGIIHGGRFPPPACGRRS